MKSVNNLKTPLDDISSKLLMEHTEFISSMERESGSEGEWKAADYFKEKMEEYGLDVKVKSIENLISLPKSAKLTLSNGDEIPCITHSYAVSTENEGLVGDIIYYADNKDIDGKIVLLEGLASPDTCYRLEQSGARALIFINGGEYVHNMAISPVWGMPVPETLDMLGGIPVISINKIDGENLIAKVKDGMNRVRILTEVETDFIQVPLCIADLRAENNTDQYVLFNGHVDSWHYGAFDNATANAAILEIARVLKKYQKQLKTNIRFVWWSGHSNGRYSGSNWYADYNWKDIYKNAVVNVNIDGIGAEGSTYYPEVASSAQCYNCGETAINRLTGQKPKYARIKRNGDQSFWGHGVPSLFQILSLQPPESQGKDTFVPGLPWFWHTSEDKFEYISEDVLTLDCKIYLEAIWDFVVNEVFPFKFGFMGEEIVENLDYWQKLAGESFNLIETIKKAEVLKELLIKFDKETEKANREVLNKEEIRKTRQKMMDLNRIIIPVHYCESGPFSVDLALSQEAFPGLSDLKELVNMEMNSLEFKAMERKMVRERNRINFAIDESINLIKQK